MECLDENRRYWAKVSRIGMIAAILYALLSGALRLISVYGFPSRFLLLTSGRYNVIPELGVAAVGAIALLIGGVLSLALRKKPFVAQTAWILGGKAILLAAPVGYIRGQLLFTGYSLTSSPQMEFLASFAILSTVFVGYAWSMRPRNGLSNDLRRGRSYHVGRNTAIVGGIMLASVLWLLLLTWKSTRSLMEQWPAERKLEYLLQMPLRVTAPVAIAVVLGYFLLSLAARMDGAPRKGRFGKGTILLSWVTLAATVMYRGMALLIEYRILDYTTSDHSMSGFQNLQDQQAVLKVLSLVVTVLGLWTLCRVLAYTKDSKLVLWGARGVLGVAVLRNLSAGIVNVISMIVEMKDQSGTDVGIIGGADVSLTVLTARLNSWLSLIFSVLIVIALCILTVGLTRHCRVSKAFWTVPILTAVSIVIPLMANVIWELIMRKAGTSIETTQWISLVFGTAIPAVITLTRSLVGVLILRKTPHEDTVVPPAQISDPGEEAKPCMEDYLFEL